MLNHKIFSSSIYFSLSYLHYMGEIKALMKKIDISVSISSGLVDF